MKLLTKYRSAFAALFVRGSGMGLQFITNLVLVRVLGPAGMGVYSLYLAWMQIFYSLASVGTTTFSLRTIAVLWGRDDTRQIRQFLGKLSWLLVATGMFVGLLAWQFAEPLASGLLADITLWYVPIMAAFAALFFSLLKAFAEALKAIEQVNLALICETLFLPFLVIALAATYWLLDWTLTVDWLMTVHIVFLLATTVLMLTLILRTISAKSPSKSSNQIALINPSLAPLWGSALLGMWFLNMPILLLPQFASAEEIGIFSMAFRLINIAVNILMVLASLYGPRFARHFAAGDALALKADLRQTRWLSLVLFLPLGVLFIGIPEYVMLIFGAQFQSGALWLKIMALGQFIYASTGLVGYMMNMIHQERQEFYISLGCSMLMFVLIIGFGSFWGTTGVAIGFAAALAAKNVTSMLFANHHLNRMHNEPISVGMAVNK